MLIEHSFKLEKKDCISQIFQIVKIWKFCLFFKLLSNRMRRAYILNSNKKDP